MRIAFALGLCLALTGCGGYNGQPASTSRPSTVTLPPNFSNDPIATTSKPPADGPIAAKIGQSMSISCDGAPCLDVTVIKQTTATRYKDPQGYVDDVPTHKGDIFMAVEVRYVAVGTAADYSQAIGLSMSATSRSRTTLL